MMPVIIAVIAFFVIIDLIPAIKAKNKKYTAVFIVTATLVLITWYLLQKQVKLPSPNDIVKSILSALVGPLD